MSTSDLLPDNCEYWLIWSSEHKRAGPAFDELERIARGNGATDVVAVRLAVHPYDSWGGTGRYVAYGTAIRRNH